MLFALKGYTQQGFYWADDIGGPTGSAESSAVTTDTAGNVYTTGYFSYTVDINPGPAVDFRVANGAKDIFITKLDANGNLLWAKTIGGVGAYNEGHAICIDNDGSVYITGFYGATADFDPGIGVYNLVSNGGREIFILKLTANGNFVWVKTIGSNGFDEGFDIKLDNNGNVYTTGYFSDTVDFDPSAGNYYITGVVDAFVLKLDTTGNFLWAKAMSGIDFNFGISISIDKNGSVYTLGYFLLTVDFNPGLGIYNLTSNGDYDIFISKLDVNGNFVWAKSIGGTSHDVGISMCLDKFSNLYFTGYFYSTVDFNPNGGTFFATAPNNAPDVYITKLDTAGNFIWAKTLSGAGNDIGMSITTDTSGNVYTTGAFSYITDFDPNSGVYNLQSVLGLGDIFISKLDGNGNFLCATALGGPKQDKSNSIYADNKGNLYITGTFMDTVDFNPELNNVFYLNTLYPTTNDVFISKLSQSCLSGVGINELNSITEEKTIIYPNPANKFITMQSDELDENSAIEITNALGQIVLTQNKISHNQDINIEALPSGMYFINVYNKNKIVFKNKLSVVK